jgi:hypothetical protein
MELIIEQNYVVVKPLQDYETYQIGGRETNIYNSLHNESAGERVAVIGEVISVPNRLIFNGKLIERAKMQLGNTEFLGKRINQLKESSVRFDVPIEIAVGDKVLFSYKNQIDCYREGRVIRNLDSLESIIIKYDTLYAVEKNEDLLDPLNGLIFVEPLKELKDIVTESGVYVLEEKIQETRKKINYSFGRIIEIGSPCKGYLDFPGFVDPSMELKSGDYIYFDERLAKNLQHEMHQTHATKRMMITRRAVHAKVIDPSKLELSK